MFSVNLISWENVHQAKEIVGLKHHLEISNRVATDKCIDALRTQQIFFEKETLNTFYVNPLDWSLLFELSNFFVSMFHED